MRKITVNKTQLQINDEITMLFEKTVTKFGTGAKIDCPGALIGKKAYVLIRDE